MGLALFTVVSLIRSGTGGWAWLFWSALLGSIATVLYILPGRHGYYRRRRGYCRYFDDPDDSGGGFFGGGGFSGGSFSGGSFGGGSSGGGGATGSW